MVVFVPACHACAVIYKSAAALTTDRDAHGRDTVVLAIHYDHMPALASELGDLRLPALRTLALDAYGAAVADVVRLFELPLLITVETLTLAVVAGLTRIRELLPALATLPPSARTVDMRFGLETAYGWQVIAARDGDGRFTELECIAHPRPHDGYPSTKIADLIADFLDHLAGDAVTKIVVSADGVRVAKADAGKVVAALGRQTSLRSSDVLGTTTMALRVAAAPPAEVQRDASTAARDAAFAAIANDAHALSPALGTIAPDRLGGATDALDAAAASAKAPSKAWAEIALRVLELPMRDRALAWAALRVLERTRPPGVAARVVAVLGREDGCRQEILAGVSEAPMAFVPARELELIRGTTRSLSRWTETA